MNKQLVVAMTSIAMITSSCVSTPKQSFRNVASEPSQAVVDIVKSGIAKQQMSLPVGGNLSFTDTPWAVRQLTDSDMKKYASVFDVKLEAGQVMTDNDLAFQRKLDVIESAQKELRMVYFIYSDDDSSSKLNKLLIKKANGGVDVTLMVDFITNYKNLDLFVALNKATNGKIKTYFYNFPTSQIFEDANYITMPCPTGGPVAGDACYQAKMSKIKEDRARNGGKLVPSAYAKLLLSGIYGKNLAAIKVALGLGAQINPADYKGKKPSSPEDIEAFKDLAVIVKEAFIDDSIIAKIKLSIAMAMYGEKINPIMNELTGRFPLRDITVVDSDSTKTKEVKSAHGAVWDHLTDYTHHKLVLADKDQFVLGGRNVEDSYHMKHRVGSEGKYIFMDTDFWGKAKDGGATGMANAFDIMRRSAMVASLETVKYYLSYDFIANSGSKGKMGPSQEAVAGCMGRGPVDAGDCVLAAIPKNEDERVREILKDMDNAAENYKTHYKETPVDQFGQLSAEDMKTATFHYLENSNSNAKDVRIKGSKVGSESENGKNIQAVWYRDLENVCKVSSLKKEQKRVIFHTAYLLMPSGLVHALAQMMNGDFGDCSRVKVTLITNSRYTTDLAPINVLARYQLGAIFDHYRQLIDVKAQFEKPGTTVVNDSGSPGTKVVSFKYRQPWPEMEYFEYSPSEDSENAEYIARNTKPQSLHTKTTLIGDDLIVGSANADVRSYAMDTNNAMIIRNAKEMNGKYVAFVDSLKSGQIKNRMPEFQGRSFSELRKENEKFLEDLATRWGQKKQLESNFAKTVLEYVDKAGQDIYNTTQRLLIYRGEFDRTRMLDDNKVVTAPQFDSSLNDAANRMDNMFKLF